jgi:hypothetical protein
MGVHFFRMEEMGKGELGGIERRNAKVERRRK